RQTSGWPKLWRVRLPRSPAPRTPLRAGGARGRLAPVHTPGGETAAMTLPAPVCRAVLFLLLLGAGAPPLVAEEAPPASVTATGGDVVLASGWVSLTSARRGGRASSIRYKKGDSFLELGNGRSALYFDVGGGRVYPVERAECEVRRRGPDAVEAAWAGK